MRIFRRLILKEWVKSYLGAFLTLLILFSIANLIAEFMRGRAAGGDILLHYLLELPKWLSKIIPISCLVASLFCLNKLKKKNELVAILSSGYSSIRIFFLVAQLGIVVAIIQLWMIGWLTPYAKSLRPELMKGQEIHFSSNEGKGIRFSAFGKNRVWFRGRGYYSSFSAFDRHNKTIHDISIYFTTENQLISKIISAITAIPLDGTNWSLKNVEVTSPLNEESFFSKQGLKSLDIDMGVDKSSFEQVDLDITKLTIFKLRNYINKLNKLGIKASEYEVIYFDMWSSSFLCLIFSLVAMRGLREPNRRGTSFGKSVGFIFVFIMVFWFIHSFFTSLGVSDKMPAYLGCFSAPLLVFGYTLLEYRKLKKLA